MDSTSFVSVKSKLHDWLKSKALKLITDKLNIPIDKVTYELTSPENSFFLSCVWFLDIKCNKNKDNNHDNDSEHDVIRLVIKKPSLIDDSDSFMYTSALFHNEILFFEKFAPQIRSEDFPRCVSALECHPNWCDSVIVMENIEQLGYQICPEVYDIPLEYTIAAMQSIGRFHAMGYAMKTKRPREFFKIVDDIQESRYVSGDKFHQFVNVVSIRPVEWLRAQNYDSHFCDIMDKYLSDAYNNIMIDAITPVESLAVLCHGDFTRNNAFFKRTSTGLTTMLFDFAMMRYSSPAVDTATFLFLNVSRADRIGRLDKIFSAYHDTLISYLKEAGIEDTGKYSYSAFYNDFKRRAMIGYIIALFYLPIIRGLAQIDPENIVNFDPVKYGLATKEFGGDDFSKELADVLLDARDAGFLDHVLHADKSASES